MLESSIFIHFKNQRKNTRRPFQRITATSLQFHRKKSQSVEHLRDVLTRLQFWLEHIAPSSFLHEKKGKQFLKMPDSTGNDQETTKYTLKEYQVWRRQTAFFGV